MPSALGSDRAPTRPVVTASLILAAWTLFVWLGRVRNVLADDTLTGWSAGWRLALSSSFVVLALAVVAAVVHQRATAAAGPTPALRLGAGALAALGIAVWAVRGTDIAVGDHSAAFIAVHVVLAVVTIALGVVVLGLLRNPYRRPGR